MPGPVSAEVLALDTEGMLREGRQPRTIADNIVVKVPTTLDGLRAIKVFKAEGRRPTPPSALGDPGAARGQGGGQLRQPLRGPSRRHRPGRHGSIADIVQLYQNYSFSTEVLVASVRHPVHVVAARLLGADVATIPYKVIAQALIKHPLTDVGIERFLADWQARKGS